MAQDFWGWLGSLFGGGRSNKPGGGSKSTGSSKASSKTRSRPPQSAPTAPPSPFKGGGGGGGGGMKAFSAPRPTTPQKDDEPSGPGRAGMSVWDAFIYGQNDSGVARWKEDRATRKAEDRNDEEP